MNVVINRKFKALTDSEKRQKLRDNGFGFYSYEADGYFLNKPIHYWNGRPTLFLEIYIDGNFEVIRARVKKLDDSTYHISPSMIKSGGLFTELEKKRIATLLKLVHAEIAYSENRSVKNYGKYNRK